MAQPSKAVKRVSLPWRGLIWQLLVITILPLAALTVLFTFGSLNVHQHAMRDLVGKRDERAVNTATAALEEHLKHRQDTMQGLALLAESASRDRLPALLTASEYLRDEFDGGIAVFTPDGALESFTGEPQAWQELAGLVGAAIPGFLEMGGAPALLTTAAANGEKMVIVLALSPDRNWVAVGVSSAEELIRRSLDPAFASGNEVSVVVVGGNEDVLYQSNPIAHGEEPAAHPGVAEALRGERGVIYVQVAKDEHVVTYSPISPVGWALVLEEPWETVDSPTLRTTQLAPLVLVPVLGLSVLALWFGLRWIVQPLQALEAKAATLAWGEFEAIEQPVGGIFEIRRLQAELIHMARKVKAAQQSLHSYIGAITTGQEEERRRLARELHDDTIQALIALKQRVQLAQLAMDNDSPQDPLTEVVFLTEQAIENVRRQVRALRPIYLEDLGLVTALEMLARETHQAAGFPVNFQSQGAERRLSAEVELALYRIAQEALNNTSQHAQASSASLTIAFGPAEIRMEVSDDGKGFAVPPSPAEFAPAGHFGLLGMSERAELIGARLEIQSTPGEGCRISIWLLQT